MSDIRELIGKTLTEVQGGESDEEMLFITSEGKSYRMYHNQDCCESVSVEDICGDLSDLVGSPIIEAEEVTHENKNPEGIDIEVSKYQDSFTWTLYKLATIKGSVTIRWYGESNGYYSESVDFCEIIK